MIIHVMMYLKIGSGIIRLAPMKKLLLCLNSLILLSIFGCSPTPTTPPPSPTATLFPLHRASATPTREMAVPIYTVIPSPGPSPTPFVHFVQKDDTLLGIAIRYGVTLEEVLAANPDINPRILSIDQEILIPSLEGDVPGGLIPTATPIPLEIAQVNCYTTITENLLCITHVVNSAEVWLEGLSVIITRFDDQGEQIGAQPAFAPLNLLPPGSVMPFGARFSDGGDNAELAIAITNTSFFAKSVEGRYMSMSLDWESQVIEQNGVIWKIVGTSSIYPENEFGTDRVSFLVTAFSETGNVVGFRKWEHVGRVEPGAVIDFEIEVYSLGPPISYVEVLAEAIPAVPEE